MREVIDFCDGWHFRRGDFEIKYPDHKTYTYQSAKTERALQGPACKDYVFTGDEWQGGVEYDGDVWENVTLPHDFIAGGIPDRSVNCGFGFLPRDNGWYVKRFVLPESDAGKRLALFFEGVAIESEIYLNGCLVKRNFSGYNSFEVDITDFAKLGERNHLAVFTRASGVHEGWWYEGGGIYRPVKLVKTDRLAVDLWGIYVKPEKVNDEWRATVQTTVRNDFDESVSARVEADILDGDGEIVASVTSSGSVKSRGKRDFVGEVRCGSPKLWSPKTPDLYAARARVFRGGKLTDEQTVNFGFRSVRIDPNDGLFINDERYEINGVCGHADCGLTGKAVPDNVHRYKARMMKEMGANGYRTSHYMQSEALMDEFDKLGFIVMDETRWFSSSDEAKEQLASLVKRDRNRPSVFFWSIGNEEPHFCTEEGRKITKNLVSLVRSLDDTRPITAAVSHDPDKATVYDELDVLGINYNWDLCDVVHEKYPNKAVFSSECCATGTTRGWYRSDDGALGYICGYDHGVNKTFTGRETVRKFIAARPWLLGSYQWIAFEHRGESVWPRCSRKAARSTRSCKRRTLSIKTSRIGRANLWFTSCRIGTTRAKRARR